MQWRRRRRQSPILCRGNRSVPVQRKSSPGSRSEHRVILVDHRGHFLIFNRQNDTGRIIIFLRPIRIKKSKAPLVSRRIYTRATTQLSRLMLTTEIFSHARLFACNRVLCVYVRERIQGNFSATNRPPI